MNPGKKQRYAFTKKTCVVATQFALAMMASQVSLAQQVAQATPKAGERIEVTGSRIPMQQNVESTSPVVVLGQEDINLTGLRNVEDVLNQLPMVTPDYGSNQSNGATGTATVNLRNLGASRTLVLINGRRLPAGSPSLWATDLNQIPATLIERVEVLTGGAASIYGSDAVAGVVNFIMKQNFQGVQGDVNYSWYSHSQGGQGNIISALNAANISVPGDFGNKGDSTDVSLTLGSNFAEDKGNATVFFSYKKDKPLLQDSYDYSKCALTANVDGSYTCGGSSTSSASRLRQVLPSGAFGPGRTPVDAAGNMRPFSTATDLFNFAPYNYYQRPSERYGFAASAHYDITKQARLYTEFNFHDDHTDAQIAPSGAFGVFATVGFDNPFLSPSYRTFLGLNKPGDTTTLLVQRRNVEGGGRDDDIRHTSYRTVVGVKGDVLRDWQYDVFMQTAKVLYQEVYRHDFSTARLVNALDATRNAQGQPVCRSVITGTDPNCVPYNVFQLGGVTQGALDYLETPGFKKGYTSQTVQGATLSAGDLSGYGLKLPSAQSGIAVAGGIERRVEKLQLETDTAFTTGDLAGQGGPTIGLQGQYTVKDIFIETRIPLIEGRPMFDTLAANASYRYSDYSTGVTTDTYGLGGEWGPVRSFKMRGSYQKAVRAPNVIDLFTAQGLNLFELGAEPCGPARTATFAQCARTGITQAQYGSEGIENPAGQYNYLQGGNPDLKPESSKSYTFGLVFTPTNSLSATVDYWNIKIDNVINNAPPGLILQQCLTAGQFCDLVHRDQFGTLWLPNGGFVTSTQQNLSKWKTSGIDVAVNYNYPLGSWGRLGLNFTGTYTREFFQEPVPGLGNFDCIGLYGTTCGSPQPEWKHRLRAIWSTPWRGVDLAATWRHVNEVKFEGTESNPLLHVDDVPPQLAKLDSRDYLDLAAQWSFSKRLTFRAGVNNVFDKDPPIADNNVAGPRIFGNGNTFPQMYDSLGRRWFVGLTVAL
jgi:outer membrane receptor protein involved in Fe transport